MSWLSSQDSMLLLIQKIAGEQIKQLSIIFCSHLSTILFKSHKIPIAWVKKLLLRF